MSHARRLSILSLLVASVGGSLTSAQVGSVLAEHEIGGASFLLTVPLDLALLGTPHHLQACARARREPDSATRSTWSWAGSGDGA